MKPELDGLGLQGLSGSFVGASDGYIAELERTIGFKLDSDYKQFLKRYGASFFSERTVFRSLTPSPWSVDGFEAFDIFYGMSDDPLFDLIAINKDPKDGSAPGIIFIGNDPGANSVQLSSDGRLYFFDRESGRRYLCAESFFQFLESFRRDT